MGVITTADERKDDALQHLKDARKNFEDCIDNNIWGGNEWSKEFKEKVIDAIHELRKLELKFE